MRAEEIIGRDSELAFLEGLWQQKGLVTCSVWGRRRVGKSTILDAFKEGKRALYLQGIRGSGYENLSSLSLDISDFLGQELPTFTDFTHLMKMVEDICKEDHTLVIIDELPYLLESSPQASSVIQKSLDRVLKHVDCMFVICGSSISVMRDETENADKPLYGRFEHTLQVKPLSISECRKFHPDMDDETSLRWYCVVGGIPQYHKVSGKRSFQQLIEEKFLAEVGSWRDDAPAVILQEFKGDSTYTGAVKCIADGSVRQSEIADKMKRDRAECKRVLDKLEFVGIVERKNPMAGAPKRPVYVIKDPFIAFHYSVITKNYKLMDGSKSADTVYRITSNDISSHIEHMFETICGEWLDSKYPILERGQWWGKSDGEFVDIDIVAKILDRNRLIHTLIGECKFSKKPMGFGLYNILISRAKDAGISENVQCMLFSALGFEDDLVEYSKENGIFLVDAEALLGKKEAPLLLE